MLTIAVVVAGLVSGCAQPFHKSPPSGLLSEKQVFTVYSFIPTDKISVSYVPRGIVFKGPGALEAILLGVTINARDDTDTISRRESKNYRRLMPLQQAVASYDFRREFWDRLDPVIADAKWFNAKSLKKLPFNPLDEKGRLLFPALILETFYALFTNFRVLSVQTRARPHISSRNKPDFEAVYSYYSDKYGTKQTSHKLWGANDGALLRRELRARVDANMSMLRRELLDDPVNRRAETGRQIKIKMRDPKT